MAFFIYFITFCNLFWLCYLTYIVYKKNSNKNKEAKFVSPDNNLKIKLTRFNPFDDIGGDQSFILCILDTTNSGVIITSLHNRDMSRIYAKSIKHGEGESNTLSKEEKTTILKTIKG